LYTWKIQRDLQTVRIGNKVSIQKSMIFLYTNIKQLENEIRKQVYKAVPPQFNENVPHKLYKALLRETNDNLNKRREVMFIDWKTQNC